MRNLEASIQRAVVDYARKTNNKIIGGIFHIPNGEKRDKITAARLKKMGVKAGVPDLCIPITEGQIVWIELKTQKGRVSKKQQEVIEWLQGLGHEVYVCYGYSEAVAVLDELIKRFEV